MGVKAWMAACAAAMACASANGASANMVTLTFQGTVRAEPGINWSGYYLQGIDGEGLFGPAGTSLVGDAFTATVKYDDAGSVFISGTSIVESAPLETDLTINGITIKSFYATYGYDYVRNLAAFGGDSDFYVESLMADGVPWFDRRLVNGIHLVYGQYILHNQAVPYYNNIGAFSFDNGSVTGFLVSTSVSVDPMPPVGLMNVPEPATWAMMLLGLGAIGAAMRLSRRRHGAALAAV